MTRVYFLFCFILFKLQFSLESIYSKLVYHFIFLLFFIYFFILGYFPPLVSGSLFLQFFVLRLLVFSQIFRSLSMIYRALLQFQQLNMDFKNCRTEKEGKKNQNEIQLQFCYDNKCNATKANWFILNTHLMRNSYSIQYSVQFKQSRQFRQVQTFYRNQIYCTLYQ